MKRLLLFLIAVGALFLFSQCTHARITPVVSPSSIDSLLEEKYMRLSLCYVLEQEVKAYESVLKKGPNKWIIYYGDGFTRSLSRTFEQHFRMTKEIPSISECTGCDLILEVKSLDFSCSNYLWGGNARGEYSVDFVMYGKGGQVLAQESITGTETRNQKEFERGEYIDDNLEIIATRAVKNSLVGLIKKIQEVVPDSMAGEERGTK